MAVTEDPFDKAPPGWWAEEVVRGNTEVLVIMQGAFPKGTVEVSSYDEKVRWLKAIAGLNSTS